MRFSTFHPMTAFSAPITDAEDISYVTSNFVNLEVLSVRYGYCFDDVRELVSLSIVPCPSFGLTDGSLYVPQTYFENACSARTFEQRLAAAARKLDMAYTQRGAELAWKHHLSGEYGVCLQTPTPEGAAFVDWCICTIERLVATPRPTDESWRELLGAAVNALDQMTREVTTFDRKRAVGIGRTKYVEDVRLRFPFLGR